VEPNDGQFGDKKMPEIRKTNPVSAYGALPDCINCKGVLHNGWYGDHNYCDDCMADMENRAEGKN
jgi:hypothetical protein